MTSKTLAPAGLLALVLAACTDTVTPPPETAPVPLEIRRLLANHDVSGPVSLVQVQQPGARARVHVGMRHGDTPTGRNAARSLTTTGAVSVADAPEEDLAFIVNPGGGKYMRDAPHTVQARFTYFCHIINPDGTVETQQAFEVTIDSIVQSPRANTGGHLTGTHDTDSKPVGTWKPKSGSTESDGSFTTVYTAGIAAGDEELRHTYTLNDTDCAGTTKTDVFLTGARYQEGLVSIPEGLFHMYFQPITSDHESVFYTTGAVNIATAFTALLYYLDTDGTDSLRINAASLIYGGINDVGADWGPPHHSHRLGTDLDLDGHTDSQPVHDKIVDAGHRVGFELCFPEMNKLLGYPDHVHCYHRTY